MSRSQPQVAQCEDYDSEGSTAKPGTKREARRRTTNSRPPLSLDRYRSATQYNPSDSGYSSQSSGAQYSSHSSSSVPRFAPAVPTSPSKHSSGRTTSKPKPILHRSESQRSSDKRPTRSSSSSRHRGSCSDPNCQHAQCHANRNFERRYSATQMYPPQYTTSANVSPRAMQPAQPVPPQALQPQWQYAPNPQTLRTQTIPVLAPTPRPQRDPATRPARPASIHGYPFPANVSTTAHGPPPSNSAYHNMQYTQAQVEHFYQMQQQRAQQQAAYQQAAHQQAISYATLPIAQGPLAYHQQSPMTTSPTSPDFRMAPAFQGSYTARPIATAAAPTLQAQSTTSKPMYSTRQAISRHNTMPGAFPRDETDSESFSESDSSASEFSEEEYERNHRARARDSRLMSSSSARRPSIKRQYVTAPVVPTREPRDYLRRNHHTDTNLGYISSGDNMDSDRTERAVIERPRTHYTGSSKSSSRRPSVSTTASSGRTKATTVSGTSGLANVIVERNGRHITYLSKRDRDRIVAAAEQSRGEEQTLEDKVRAYQAQVRGDQPPELTAENIREYQQRPRSRSHISGHSRKTSRSSSKTYDPESIKIVHGGNVVHLPPGSKVEMRSMQDGTSTLIIGSTTSSGREREGKYYSSSRQSTRRGSRGDRESEQGSWEAETAFRDMVIEEDSQDDLR